MNQPLDLDAIQARCDAATPGPWRWRGNTEARHLRLQTPHHGGLTVMDFKRWGMQGARPRFARDHLMYPANEMVTYEVAAWSKDIYRKDIVGIEHPDAEFIAAAREDVPALLARVRELEAAIGAVLALPTATDEELERMDPEAYQQTTGRDDAIADIQQMLRQPAPSGPQTPTLTGWAADMADASLTPYDGALTLDADDAPFVRLHFAFAEDMPDADRERFLTQLGRIILAKL
ncbi:hypothetical protein AB0D10_05490 [Kitasatospora sp. NPDC048545]|uniref:hypothetical protein n=1 Tax=Kitasatospora sp. NPDC048545 TaxID=3157208 RepID=UPI0033FA6E95